MQGTIEHMSGKKMASASFLYRNPIFENYLNNFNCNVLCSMITSQIKNADNRTDETFNWYVNNIRSEKNVVDNLQVGTLLETLAPLVKHRLSAVMLYFGCTTRTNGNDHDVRDIVTDMQRFNCSSMAPNGDGPGLCNSVLSNIIHVH